MTEYSASIFVFFFLGEYSSLIIMSAFMSIFFLGGYHCPNLYSLILNPIEDIYYYISSFFTISNYIHNISSVAEYYNDHHYDDRYLFSNTNIMTDFNLLGDLIAQPKMEYISNDSRFYQSISILIDRIYGSYIFGIKIVTVVFFFI
jgi:NADH dehydrogenase